jgi:long-chain acyl-CoA synthetase
MKLNETKEVEMNIYEILTSAAERTPDKPSIISENKTVSCKGLFRLTRAISQYLYYSEPFSKGDRVGILLPNTPEFVAAYFAVLKLGGVAVPLKTLIKPDELSYLAADSGAELIITSRYFEKVVEPVRENNPELKILYVDDLDKKPKVVSLLFALPHKVREVDEDDTAVIIYTSGTTGKPKGAILTHRNILSNVRAATAVFQADPADRFVAVLPMFHSFGMTAGVLIPLYIGASIITLMDFQPVKTIMAIEKHRATVLLGVPFIYTMLARVKGQNDSMRTIRCCISGGAAMPEKVLREFEEKFGVPIHEGIGLSETSPVIAVNPIGKRKIGSVGVSIPGVQIKIIGKLGEELAPGEPGEMLVKGPNVMKGYLNKEEETGNVLKDGWFHTGDIARKDEDGYIYIVGRKKEMISVRGLKVSPLEIEEILYAHPNIQEAAVVGVKDELSGELPKAFIVPKDRLMAREDEIISFCKEHLASFKVPKLVEFRDALPKTLTGKVLKRALVEECEAVFS